MKCFDLDRERHNLIGFFKEIIPKIVNLRYSTDFIKAVMKKTDNAWGDIPFSLKRGHYILGLKRASGHQLW